ncbi:hypothetical protein AcW1_000364 [Taiwanofungus camphoratus]|nr:hypothetical protein AcW2_001139 [Antrodia cinnamomea]KAI0961231.1 hypothetical protein AcV7_000384 [Antrodia cinnamomea]KAI0963232.1 hypothetical protein AcW1_000364 [Antrodia cinnamomea]
MMYRDRLSFKLPTINRGGCKWVGMGLDGYRQRALWEEGRPTGPKEEGVLDPSASPIAQPRGGNPRGVRVLPLPQHILTPPSTTTPLYCSSLAQTTLSQST